MEEKVNEAIMAVGEISIGCTRMLASESGDQLRERYTVLLQDVWKLFNAVNSRLLDEGKG